MQIDETRRPKYNAFSIKKANGKDRKISAPDDYTKAVQHHLMEHLEKLYVPHASVYGFVKGRSVFDNAEKHLNQECVLNLDLKDFFPSIRWPDVIFSMNQLMEHEPAEYRVWLTGRIYKWCMWKGSLPQGAPTSPILSNIVATSLDVALSKYAQENQLVYTRYADDLTFSGSNDIIYNKLEEIKLIIRTHKFTINTSKVRVYKEGRRKEVTGILVDKKINIQKKDFLNMRAILHNIEEKIKDGVVVDAVSLQRETGMAYDQLRGFVNFMMQANPEKYRRYQDQLADMRMIITR